MWKLPDNLIVATSRKVMERHVAICPARERRLLLAPLRRSSIKEYTCFASLWSFPQLLTLLTTGYYLWKDVKMDENYYFYYYYYKKEEAVKISGQVAHTKTTRKCVPQCCCIYCMWMTLGLSKYVYDSCSICRWEQRTEELTEWCLQLSEMEP